MKPQLVIVLVSKDNPEAVARTLASLFTLDASHNEILVIDSSEGDQIKSLINATKQGPPKKYVWIPPTGIYPAMNEALRYIDDNSYVMYLNPGDLLLAPQALISLTISLGSHNQEWGFGRAIANGKSTSTAFPPIKTEISKLSFLNGELSISHQAIIVKKSTLTLLGGFRQSLRIAADFNLIAQLIDKYIPGRVEEILISYDEFGTSHEHILRTYYESTIVRRNNSDMTFIKCVSISVRNFIRQRDFLRRNRVRS